MLAEFLAAVAKMAVDAKSARVLPTPAEPKHRYAIEDRNGVFDWYDAAPSPRQHVAGDLATLVAWALETTNAEHGGDGAPPAPKAVIWYSRAGVVCVLDDATRRDRVTLPLSLSPQLEAVVALPAGGMEPRALGKMLRTTFHDCLTDSCGLAKSIDKLRFESGEWREAAVARDKSSLGTEVRQQVSGVNAVPEKVVLTVPVFAAGVPDLRGGVNCAIEFGFDRGTVQLIPLPGEVERVVAGAEKEIAERLAIAVADKVGVFYGTP